MLRSNARLFSHAILLTDVAIVNGAMLASPWVTQWFAGPANPGTIDATESTMPPTLLVALAFLIWLPLSSRLELYLSRRAERLVREVQNITESFLLCLGLLAMIALSFWDQLPFRPIATIAVGITLFAMQRLSVRLLLRHYRRKGRNFRSTILVGQGPFAPVMGKELRANSQYGIQLHGTLRFASEEVAAPGITDLGRVEDLQDYLKGQTIDYVLVCPSPEVPAGEIQDVYNTCEQAGIPCHYLPGQLELARSVPSVVWYGSVPAWQYTRLPDAPVAMFVKRAVDVVGSFTGLVILSPVLLAIALAIKLTDGGCVFFRQSRVGLSGRTFPCVKFRTMCPDAESRKGDLEALNEQDGPVFKVKDDPRITRVGRFLRKYSLDELPQLWNVLIGEMSLVGPRPPTPNEVDDYKWWQRRRISVRPGITCIWQVWGRNRVSFQRWMEMDLYYIDNWSLWMDFKLMLRTLQVVLRGTGM